MPNCIAFIPAKGHSNRLPGKNMRLCAGKTLVQRAVDCAVASRVFSWVVVSSEDWELLSSIPRNLDVRLHFRPPEYSEDGVGVASVVAAWLGMFPSLGGGPLPESFCVLWPTSPLRTPEHMRCGWDIFQEFSYPSLHSRAMDHTIHDGTALFMRTQEFLKVLSLDLRDYNLTYGIPENDSLDVNTPEDLAEAERRLLEREAVCRLH